MVVHLGKSEMRGSKLDPRGAEICLWLHEGEDVRACLESEDGLLPYLAVKEGWRVYIIEGSGVWRASFLGHAGKLDVLLVHIWCNNGRWKVEFTDHLE